MVGRYVHSNAHRLAMTTLTCAIQGPLKKPGHLPLTRPDFDLPICSYLSLALLSSLFFAFIPTAVAYSPSWEAKIDTQQHVSTIISYVDAGLVFEDMESISQPCRAG